MDKEVHKAFTENTMEYFAHVQTVCTRPLLRGCLGTRLELLSRCGEKERWTSVPILCRITLQNAPYMDYNLLMLTSFEVTTMDSQEPACCDSGHLLASTK